MKIVQTRAYQFNRKEKLVGIQEVTNINKVRLRRVAKLEYLVMNSLFKSLLKTISYLHRNSSEQLINLPMPGISLAKVIIFFMKYKSFLKV